VSLREPWTRLRVGRFKCHSGVVTKLIVQQGFEPWILVLLDRTASRRPKTRVFFKMGFFSPYFEFLNTRIVSCAWRKSGNKN